MIDRSRNLFRPEFLSIVFAVACLIFPVAGDAGSSRDAAVHVDIKPGYLVQGGLCRIIFSPAQGYEMCGARFGKSPLVLKDMGSGRYLALIGAGLKERPGRKKLTANVCSKRRGRKTITKYIYIKRKKYPEEHLKVPGKMVEFPPDILKRVLADQRAVRHACSRVTSKIYWNTPFIWPVNSKVLSPFGLRRFFNGKPRSPHSGVDLRAGTGTVIKAPANGRVILVRDCYLSGNTLVIDHGGGLFTLYAHLSDVKVRKGQQVRRGDAIGLAGATGRVTGPHLHWGVSLLGDRVDPAQLMKLLGS